MSFFFLTNFNISIHLVFHSFTTRYLFLVLPFTFPIGIFHILLYYFYLCFIYLFLVVTVVWTQGFAFAAGVLPLEPHLQSILLWIYWRWSFKICPYWPQIVTLLISVSQVAGIARKNHRQWASALFFHWVIYLGII
jgi:hypothetical protein